MKNPDYLPDSKYCIYTLEKETHGLYYVFQWAENSYRIGPTKIQMKKKYWSK